MLSVLLSASVKRCFVSRMRDFFLSALTKNNPTLLCLAFLVHPTVVLVLLSASVKRCFVSCMQDFFEQMIAKSKCVKVNCMVKLVFVLLWHEARLVKC